MTQSLFEKNCIHSFPVFGVYKSPAELIVKILLVLPPEFLPGSFFCSVLTAIALVEALLISCLSFLPELLQTMLHGISREMVLNYKSGPWPLWLSLLENCLVEQNVAGLVPGQGTCLGCRFDLRLGHLQEGSESMFLSLFPIPQKQ